MLTYGMQLCDQLGGHEKTIQDNEEPAGQHRRTEGSEQGMAQ